MTTVAIIAPGTMGAALAHRLADGGVRVLTSLAGRSSASIRRAKDAGMVDGDDDALAAADIILSVLTPSDAPALAERLVPALAAAAKRPVYVDCNAVSPETVKGIARRIEATGCPFVDVGIIGPPPTNATLRTVLYASGEHASRLEPLAAAGLCVRTLPGPVGAASALKMSYAGITKGLTALGTAMALAATHAGADQSLAQELLESQPVLADWLRRQIPGMIGKAYRWSGEMNEIAQFLEAHGGPPALFAGAAVLYESVARSLGTDRADIAALEIFVTRLR